MNLLWHVSGVLLNDYLSEIFRIIEGAVRQDGVKVRNYAALLADKLEGAGEEASAKRLRKLIDDKSSQLHPTKLSQSSRPPVDGESRFPLLERLDLPDSAPKHLLTGAQSNFIEDFVSVVTSRGELERRGISSGTNLLLYGPPGCGKSHLAAYLADRLSLPLYVARLDGLISSFLGSTAKNIRAVFEFASRTPCVLLLDEFDAIAKFRDDQQELGELKRVVNSFIQNIDGLSRDIILVAATNHDSLLDPAVWRRFQYLLHIGLPDTDQRHAFWHHFSGEIEWGSKELKVLADLSEGFSVAAIEAASMKVRQSIITRELKPTLRDALLALASLEHGNFSEGTVLAQLSLNEPCKIQAQLMKRDPKFYSLTIIGEIAGVSKATMSRRASPIKKTANTRTRTKKKDV